jgi:diacylglycerol kinase family enzyme
MIYTLYNPKSYNGHGQKDALKLRKLLAGQMEFIDITGVEPVNIINRMKRKDEIIICGGDGTLNRFVNAVYDLGIENRIRYFQAGSGNDFARDVRSNFEGALIELNQYIEDLPYAVINGSRYRFLNGIGYGLDGYCCEKSDEVRAKSGGKSGIKGNYSLLALRGLLFDFAPRSAKVTVDGVTRSYNNVLMAPTMNGRYYGGGIMIAPKQHRLDRERTVSVVVVHDLSKLRALTIFPLIYFGKHIQ